MNGYHLSEYRIFKKLVLGRLNCVFLLFELRISCVSCKMQWTWMPVDVMAVLQQCFLKLDGGDDRDSEEKWSHTQTWAKTQDAQKQIGVQLVPPVSCSQTLDVITQWIMMERTHILQQWKWWVLWKAVRTVYDRCKMLHIYTRTAGESTGIEAKGKNPRTEASIWIMWLLRLVLFY